jgi:hypothetical protein
MDKSFDKSDCVKAISSGWDERSVGKVMGGCHDVGGINDGYFERGEGRKITDNGGLRWSMVNGRVAVHHRCL